MCQQSILPHVECTIRQITLLDLIHFATRVSRNVKDMLYVQQSTVTVFLPLLSLCSAFVMEHSVEVFNLLVRLLTKTVISLAFLIIIKYNFLHLVCLMLMSLVPCFNHYKCHHRIAKGLAQHKVYQHRFSSDDCINHSHCRYCSIKWLSNCPLS